MKWRDPISEMPRRQSHSGKRKELRASRSPDVEEEAPSLGRYTRAVGERRSKAQEDRRVTTALKGKARARELSPPRKRRAVVMVSEDDEDEDERSEEGFLSGSLREQSWRYDCGLFYRRLYSSQLVQRDVHLRSLTL